MKQVIFTSLLVAFCCIVSAYTQTTEVTKDPDSLEDRLSVYPFFSQDLEDYFARLADTLPLVNTPLLSLNSLTKEDLEKLGILNEDQIKSFLTHRKQIGAFSTPYGVQAIPGWDSLTVERLFPLIALKETFASAKIPEGYAQSAWQTTLRFRPSMEEKEPAWTGNPHYLAVQLRHRISSRMEWGLGFEKDAGEKWVHQRKPEHFLFSASWQSRIRGGPAIYAGNFRTSWGQGLLNASYGTFKSILVSDISRSPLQVSSLRSFSEDGYYHGILLQLPLNNFWTWVPMVSFRRMDGTPARDSSKAITQLVEGGYHRTVTDLNRKGNTGVMQLGSRLQRVWANRTIGLNTTYQHMRPALANAQNPYQTFYPKGAHHPGISADYQIQTGVFRWSGELSLAHGWAHIAMLQMIPNPSLEIAGLYRHYGRNYAGLMGQAWGENSTNRNEQGYYFGISWQINPFWKVAIYQDTYRHHWVRYQVDAPTRGQEQRGRVSYERKKGIRYYLEWHRKEEEDTRVDILGIYRYKRQQWRAHLEVPLGSIRWRTRFDGGWVEEPGKFSRGYSFWSEALIKKVGKNGNLAVRLGQYATPGYEVRFYQFEPQITGAYAMNPYYGKGVFLHLVAKIDLPGKTRWEMVFRKTWGNEGSLRLSFQCRWG